MHVFPSGMAGTRLGWLGSNLYPLGIPDVVIQRILRHANVSTTLTYYIKTAADDVRKAMMTLENGVTEAGQV
jgi:integrase